MARWFVADFGVGLGVAAALIALGAGCGREGAAPGGDVPRRPNVVPVTFDALRADAVSYGAESPEPSPRLAELAEDGVVFSQAVSSFIGTTPSMPSLMTWLWPSFEGVSQWNGDTWNGFWDLKSPDERGKNGLTAHVTTLAERLRRGGFATAGFNTNPFLGVADGAGAGMRVEQPVRMVDVAPTILAAVGLGEQAAALDGAPLQPFLDAGDSTDRTAFVSAPGYGVVRSAPWKLRVWKGGERPDELYRIDRDPLETSNLAASEPGIARELRGRWDSFAQRLRGRSGSVVPPLAADAPPIEPETREQLEALGYAEP